MVNEPSLKNHEQETQLLGQQKRAKGQLKIPPKTTINLEHLQTTIKQEPQLTINNPAEIDERGKKYLSISFNWLQQKNTINIFKNGKFVCWYMMPNKAWSFFIDFINYSIIQDCLQEEE